jgi:GWxTD domain-containing protein
MSLGLYVSALVLAATAHAEDVAEKPPFESEGDIQFFVDAAGFQGSEGLTEEEFYVSVSNDQLELGADAKGLHRGDLRMRIIVRDERGKELGASEVTLNPQAATAYDASDRGVVQSIRQPLGLPPGRHYVEVSLVDERALRAGLLNRIRNKKKSGRVQGWVHVPSFDSLELAMSDVTLARTLASAGGEATFGRNGVDFDPNPARRFGLAVPIVRSYLEVYGGDTFEPGRTYLVRTRVLDRTGAVVMRRTTRASPRSAAFVLTEEVPLRPREIAPGSYTLSLEVEDEATTMSVAKAVDFEVIWSVASWGQDEEELLQEMRLIMAQSEFDTLKGLSIGAREIYLAEYWSALDPDPVTPENEALQEFRARVRYADQQFRSTLERGILSDRGRVFVRYGRADDVLTEYSSSGFGDTGGERVAGPAERVNLGNRPATSFLDADEFLEGDVSDVAQQRGGANIEAKELEVWVYDGPGRPLTKHQDLNESSHRGLKFIFADQMGNGNFTLIGSSGTSIY